MLEAGIETKFDMKTFVVLLLLANFAYFGWNQGWLRDVPPPRAAISRPAADDLPPFIPGPASLTLLAELPAGTLPEPVTTPESSVGADPRVRPQDPEPGAELTSSVGADPRVRPQDPEVSTNLQSSTAPESLAGTRPQAPNNQPWCANLGLFTLEEEAATLLPRVQALGIEARVQSGMAAVASTFWVHLPAFASEAEAFRTLQELQERNIDSYYMRSGDMAGGISLGVFSRPESAETARANLERRGYDPLVREVKREENRFWVALAAPTTAVLETPQWLDFRANFPSLPLAENVCEAVALPPGFP
jgi:cell division septation protein DedD